MIAPGKAIAERIRVERWLQLTVAAMASLGTLVLGMGQRSVLLPAVAIFVAVTSVYVTDIRGWLRLNRNLANLFAIVAVLVSVSDFFRLERDSQLLAVANLLIYLQIVLMYQRKDTRIFWQLLMLSLLQVVVAAALNFGMLFGWLLLLYMFLGLFALLLFFAYREQEELLTESDPEPAPRRRRGPPPAIAIVRQEGLHAGDVVRGSMLAGVLRYGLLTCAVATAIFIVVPRFDDEAWSQGGPRVQRVVGFDDSVELGTLGTAYQNASAVMRVWFTDPQTEQPYLLQGEPLFRGAVVNHYDEGNWRHRRRSRGGDPALLPISPGTGDVVQQNTTLMPLNEETVFAVPPVFRFDADDRTVRYDANKEQLIRLAHYQRSDFALATLGFEHGVQREITLLERPMKAIDELQLWQLPQSVFEPFPALAQKTREILAAAGVDAEDTIAAARAIDAHLRDSGEYSYTLDGIPRTAGIDPIEDFISVNKRGHCEYFSTALTLMLRTQQIPARMVIGFKSGEWNDVGKFYVVRQLHAHSWTEVYLPPEQVPAELLAGRERPNYGAWLRLDPTPATELIDDAAEQTLAGQLRQWADYSDYLWSNYVVGLDAEKQRETIYQPLVDGISASIQSLFSAEAWLGRWQSVSRWWRETVQAWIVANAFSWRGVLALALLVSGIYAMYLLARLALSQWHRRREVRGGDAGRRRRTVEFYQRLESILARQGIRRGAAQTQHEFAVAAGGRLAEMPPLRRHAALPRRIVDAFYRVRFGGRALSPAEEASIENSLQQLSRGLRYK